MRMWFTWTQVITIAVALLLVLCIPLNERRMAEVRRQLDARRVEV
jgi:Na+/melibiose symporter-like transporter